MRSTFTAIAAAAAILGFSAAAQAAPVPAGGPVASGLPVELAQLTHRERHMVRRRAERRMIERRVERRMIRRQVRREMRRGW